MHVHEKAGARPHARRDGFVALLRAAGGQDARAPREEIAILVFMLILVRVLSVAVLVLEKRAYGIAMGSGKPVSSTSAALLSTSAKYENRR